MVRAHFSCKGCSKKMDRSTAIWASRTDRELNAAERVVYDALYAPCQEMVRRGKPDGAFR